MKKYYIFFLCITVLSCSQQEPLLDTALDNQILHWGNGSEPQSLDPHIATGVPEHHVLIALCEGLTITNPKGGDNLPGVAQAWDISDDGLIYTFFLQPNAKWSNGDDLIAEDFVWSWKRILTASLGSQYPDMLYYLKNAEEYHAGKIQDFSEVGVEAIDAKTLKVTLRAPTPFFTKLLSHYSTWPVHKKTILNFGEIDNRNGEWTRPGNFVCNGPMKLKSWELNKKIIVDKNPMYWDYKQVQLNEIHYYPVVNESTEDRMFRAGQLHVTNVVPLEKCPVYLEQNNPNLRVDPYMGTYFYRTNTTIDSLNNKKVRKALAYAIDRKMIVDNVSKCGQQPAYSFTPPGSAGYEPNTEIPYDPELAKQLLAEAGYENGEIFSIRDTI
ncbi:MAG: hypothetical protein CM15mP127_09140 [Gammaproteobacteria bacterium]|nr:MAG: hypothetical protein CM15mP127_09140 [Gammaproteobacteria bacterium]